MSSCTWAVAEALDFPVGSQFICQAVWLFLQKYMQDVFNSMTYYSDITVIHVEIWNGKSSRCVTSCTPAELINLPELSRRQLFRSFLGIWKYPTDQLWQGDNRIALLNRNQTAGRSYKVTLCAHQSSTVNWGHHRVEHESHCKAGWKQETDLNSWAATSWNG